MAKEIKKNKRSLIFPMGVFFLLLIVEILIISSGISTYFYIAGRKHLNDIEKYTINYSKTLAESFAEVAELSAKTRSFRPLKDLFHKKIEEDTIDEAFFVLGDGKIVAHSNTKKKKELKGNIATDEMSYNIDMILAPLKKKDRRLYFSNYNIVNNKIPFIRDEINLIKKYLYKDIRSNGWIFTRAVYHRNKPLGTVNFIINKSRIHNSILYHVNKARHNIVIGLFVSFFISLFISIFVMFRYNKVYEQDITINMKDRAKEPEDIVIDLTGEDDEILVPGYTSSDSEFEEILDEPVDEEILSDEEDLQIRAEEVFTIDEPVIEDTVVDETDDEYITVEFLGEIEDSEKDTKGDEDSTLIAQVLSSENVNSKIVKDAIPILRKDG